MSRGPTSDQSSFVLAMGNTPFIRVISFFLDNRIFDYSKTDIAKNAEVGWSTLHGIWKRLEEFNIVSMTRRVGKSKMYKLNEENPIVRKMIEIDASISEHYATRIAQEQIKPIAIK
jgi:DNA-binding transcriptional ArsR family regulator